MTKTIRISDKIHQWLQSIKKKWLKKMGVRITDDQILTKLKKGEKIEP